MSAFRISPGIVFFLYIIFRVDFLEFLRNTVRVKLAVVNINGILFVGLFSTFPLRFNRIVVLRFYFQIRTAVSRIDYRNYIVLFDVITTGGGKKNAANNSLNPQRPPRNDNGTECVYARIIKCVFFFDFFVVFHVWKTIRIKKIKYHTLASSQRHFAMSKKKNKIFPIPGLSRVYTYTSLRSCYGLIIHTDDNTSVFPAASSHIRIFSCDVRRSKPRLLSDVYTRIQNSDIRYIDIVIVAHIKSGFWIDKPIFFSFHRTKDKKENRCAKNVRMHTYYYSAREKWIFKFLFFFSSPTQFEYVSSFKIIHV